MATVYSPPILGIIAGWGGALGEVTTYYLGWGVAEFVRGNDGEKGDEVDGWIKRYGLWAVLLVSITPLPDTPIVLLTGSGRLPFKKLLLVEGIGKTIYYTLGAFIGGFIFTDMTEVLGGFYASTIVFSFSLAFTFLVTWSKSRNAILRLIERFTSLLRIS
jgi:membrane protein DedA with SNARE-associated domain